MERPKRKAKPQRYDPEFRVKVVKTALSKKLSIEEIFKVYGVRASAWCSWKKIYVEQGEDALRWTSQSLSGFDRHQRWLTLQGR